MLAYIVRRTALLVSVFFALTYAVFFLTTQQGVVDLHHLTLTTLLPIDYLLWMTQVLHGNFGYSIYAGSGVADAIKTTAQVSLMLVIPAFILQEAISIGLGLLAGSRYKSIFDRLFTGVTFVLASIPQFWLALLAIIYISVQLNLLPFGGLTSQTDLVYGTPQFAAYFHAHTLAMIGDIAKHLTLPVILLAVIGSAADGQFVRLSIVEVLSQEYIRAARARGLSRRLVLWKHALRNAVLPLITNIGLQLPNMIFAAAIIEFIFNLPGLGQLFIRSTIFQVGREVHGLSPTPPHDYAVISAYFLVLGAVAIAATLVTDVAYALADPRVRLGGNTPAIAPTPMASGRRLFTIGKLSITTGTVGVAALVAVVGTFGVLSVRSLLAPRPTVTGTWVGPDLSAFQPPDTVFVLLTVTEQQHGLLSQGTVTGTMLLCAQNYTGQIGTNSYVVTGYTDTSTAYLTASASGETFYIQGNYVVDNNQLILVGVDSFSANATAFTNAGTTNVEIDLRRGTHGDFDRSCATVKH